MQISYIVKSPIEEKEIITTNLVEEKPSPFNVRKLKEIFEKERDILSNTDIKQQEDYTQKEEISPDIEDMVEENFEIQSDLSDFSKMQSYEAIGVAPCVPIGGEGIQGIIGVGSGSKYGGGLDNRKSKKVRRRKAILYGGGEKVLKAVERALRYLARVQHPEGYWKADKENEKGRRLPSIGATALATLCFLGSGHSEISGKYRRNVRKAIYWIIKQQKEDGGFEGNLYHTALATIVLTEEYAMATNPLVLKAAKKAIRFILQAQNPFGGWGDRAWSLSSKRPVYPKKYRVGVGIVDRGTPGLPPGFPGYRPPKYKTYKLVPHPKAGQLIYSESDGWKCVPTIEGWMMMALRSAKFAGIKMDEKKIRKALKCFSFFTDPKTKYFGGHYWWKIIRTPETIAVGMCIKQFYGMNRDNQELIKPAEFILRHLPSIEKKKSEKLIYRNMSFYYLYFATLAMFQEGGKYWRLYNKAMLKALLPTQIKQGNKAGSWDPPYQKYSVSFDSELRVVSTSFYCLALEVYWRYMPLYQ